MELFFFDKRSLYRYVQFYQMYPEIVGTVTPQSRLITAAYAIESAQPYVLFVIDLLEITRDR